MRVIFFSASERALSVLEALYKSFELVAVVSQPDRPVGRKRTPTPTAISVFAQERGILLLRPEKLDEKTAVWLAQQKPDVLVSVYYGLLVPPEILNITPHGVLNIHPSLLPRWRGPSPAQAAIVAGDKETGVTIMKMDEKFDHGPIVSQFRQPVLERDNQETLYRRLFAKAADVLIEILPAYLADKIRLREQEHDKATYCRLVKKEHGFIPPRYLAAASQGQALRDQWQIPFIKDYSLQPTPYALERFIRALTPWPGAWTEIALSEKGEGKRLKILEAHIEKTSPYLLLDLVQLEGKNPVSWKQFRQAYPEARL